MNDRELTATAINLAYHLEKRFCSWDTAKKCAAFAVQYLGNQEPRKPREWIVTLDESGYMLHHTEPLRDGWSKIKVREVIE